ncbi:MAG: hypothetical protein UHE62_06300 [Muribaculaceae bacterium]|nr:hypothetical protein [Muribaculaceae bacterium]
MILINKNQEPKEWTEYCSTPGVTYQSIPELVDALLKEQGYICAYCMRRIPTKDKIEGKLTSEDHRIEHIKCRDNHEYLQLKYNNMLICCPGHIGEDEHCDRKKGNQEISFSPLDSAFINTLTYTSNGIIASSNPVYNEEINSILNLNTPFLVLNRKNMLKEVIQHINQTCKQKKNWNKTALKSILVKYQNKHKDGENQKYYPYCGIVVWFIQKKLNTL